MIQTVGQRTGEAEAFFIILVIALLVLYVYYGWVRPIKNLQDKSKPIFPSVISLLVAIIPLIFIAWAIVDEIKRVTGLKADIAAEAAAAPVDTSNAEAFKGVELGVPAQGKGV
jgi:phosphoglycerol transferase MdoB-like AlkP superfamily enzyme